jgi:hypothetical protein
MAIKLLPPHVVDQLRKGGCNDQGNPFEPGVGTGRGTCRACGEKIAKGVDCLKGSYDFAGGGSWTSTTCSIHMACPKVQN